MINKIPVFYGIRQFVTVFITPATLHYPEHVIQSTPIIPISLKCIIILSSYLGLGKSHLPIPATCPAHLILHDFLNLIIIGSSSLQIIKLLPYIFL
jgi:hypothetical protein